MGPPVSGTTPKPRAVTFDVWYTLVYLEPDEEEAYVADLVQAAAELLVGWPPGPKGRPAPSLAKARSVFRRQFESAASLSRQGISRTPAEQIRRAADRLDRRSRPNEYVRRVEELVERAPLRRAANAAGVLDQLQRAGYRIGIVSNTVGEPGRALQRVLERLGLARTIGAWAWSDEHPWTKPAPELFRWCLRRLGVPPGRSIHVGDGWSDVVGARRAGFLGTVQFIGHASYSPTYARSFAPPIPRSESPSRVVRTFRSMPTLIDRLFDRDPGTPSRVRGPG
jgi:putative hydrolase of the HAD superfamily